AGRSAVQSAAETPAARLRPKTRSAKPAPERRSISHASSQAAADITDGEQHERIVKDELEQYVDVLQQTVD
ncbi:MAG: hypothetical protein LRY67_02160, partial [Gammaproteobacteria bacterium]|nr:hypothetical protein [Gammaproteobacteria bacterium]